MLAFCSFFAVGAGGDYFDYERIEVVLKLILNREEFQASSYFKFDIALLREITLSVD